VQDLDALLDLAKRAAALAGAQLRDHRAEWSTISEVQGREVKVDADKRVEAIILDLITRESALPILSEEAGWVGPHLANAVDEYAWAIDPLDGSVNYISGYPHCGVSIALLCGKKPILGVIELFLLDETFSGVVGKGAWLNGAPIAVSAVDDPSRGILNTGIPARAATEDPAFARYMNEMLSWRKVRMMGSAAAALAYVAAGRADAYREQGSMLWDVAAGCALVEAAGGRATLTGPALDKPLSVSASNAALADRMLQRV
jgi:myo-inositol-1(or 4)-monophosphatase